MSTVLEVSGPDAQQRVLRDFRTAAMSGVTVLGVQRGGRTFVVARCASTLEEGIVQAVVAQLDPGAVPEERRLLL